MPADTRDQIAIGHRLLTVHRDGFDVVALEVSGRSSSGEIRLQAEFNPEYLWNADAVLLTESSACSGEPVDWVAPCGLRCARDRNDR